MSSYWLQVREPGHPAKVVTVDGALEVGRDCDGLQLDDPTVSRRHVRFDATDEGLVVVDLDSANGTVVNGALIGEPTPLRTGDVVRVGESELVVHEGHEITAAEGGEGGEVVVEPLDRPSEAVRDLARATRRRS